jgi:uncharacterized protein
MEGSLVTALALMLVLEGLLPFAAPKIWRETFQRATELADGQIRFLGLGSMLLGMALFALFF